jgi:hypothetical protein
MILFQDVIEVLHWSMSTVLLQSALGFELHDRRRVSGMLVGVDDKTPLRGGCIILDGYTPPLAKMFCRKRTGRGPSIAL